MVLVAIVALPVSSQAQIWTGDEQGNTRTDFEPEENVYIRGSGFNPNAQINVSVMRPDNTDNAWYIYGDSGGGFETSYQLDGITGTYTVVATDGTNATSTTFEDCLRMLEGYDKAAERWERGLLEGWKELEWVPYRIKFARLPKGTSNFSFNVYHNNLLGGKDGVDSLNNFRVGDEDGNPVDGSVTALGPFYKEPGKSSDRDVYYSLEVTFNTPSWWLNWYVYWDAHLAIGSSGWPGAKLHAYSGITGCQTIPIKVPPVPLGSISGAKWNDLSYNGIWDNGEPGLSGWTIQLYFFDPVENSWINIDNENTGLGGSYTFGGLAAGNYRVNEVLKTNWIQTFPPSPGSYSITLSEGENRKGINFGNVLATCSVSVSISPSYQSGANGATLTYTVTVNNTGNVSDTYSLTPTDTTGWSPSVSPTSLIVSPGNSGNATLSVTIPSGAVDGTIDNMTVTATSQTDSSVSDSASCTAQVTVSRGVSVSISPTSQSGANGATLTYTVTVSNTGNVSDTYSLTVADNAGWSENVSPTSLTVSQFSSGNVTLSVTVPDNAIGGTIDNVTVTATGTGVSGSGNCTAQVTINRGVNISISPSSQSGANGAALTYTVTVNNTGNVSDTYSLTPTDTTGWSPSVSPTSLTVSQFSSGNATLSVTVPSNAIGGTIDNVTVTATGTGVSGSDSCTAQVTINRGVNISISPSSQGDLNGAVLTYTVTVVNLGNVTDTYDLTTSDNSGWNNIWLEDNTLRVGGFDNDNMTTLHVEIPDNAKPCTEDNIIVTAISRADNSVKNSDSCIAHAAVVRDVKVSISPALDNGLVKNVTITNMGNVVDNFSLTAEENVSWRLMLAENLFGNVMPGENRVTTLRITIPSDTKLGTVGGITVTATSQIDPEVSGSGGAQVTAIRAVDVSISPKENWGSGETLVYVVTIRNIGNTVDNYYITKTDELGWLVGGGFLWLYDVAPGGFASVNLEVTIPENVKLNMKDVITVTATSQVENTVFDNDNCVAFGPNFAAGWNLISFWQVSENDTPNNIFAVHPILHTMYYWNAPFGPYTEPPYDQPVKLGVGYWVYVNKPACIRTTGEPVENYSIDLVAGWNMVGFPVTSENTTPNNLFAGTTYTMYYWEAPYGPYVEAPNDAPVKLGVGYWVKVNQNTTATVPL